MAKISKDDLLNKINERLSDNNELAIELMEDITDSFQDFDTSEYDKKLQDSENKYNDLLNKYKERFINSEVKTDEKKDIENPSENEVIDVTDIFK